MPDISDIFRDNIAAYPFPLSEVQRHAAHDICVCRTPHMRRWAIYSCPNCGEQHFAFPSCGNRNCPKCGQDKVAKFLAKQQQNLLPVNYFMITVTMPTEMHRICRLHPKTVFNAFFHAAEESIRELARNKKHLGGEIGLIGTLQTWKRNGDYHPHIHFLVPGGGLSPDGQYWLFPRKRDFFIPARPLSILVRGKMHDAIRKLGLCPEVSPDAWKKHWVSDCSNVGNGMSSFKYLAPYMQRGFISNSRIVDYDGEKVTFSYVESATNAKCLRTISAIEFMRLYLQHVLPSGFQKTRYYGLLGSANSKTIRELRLLILCSRFARPVEILEEFKTLKPICPKCKSQMVFYGMRSRSPPEILQSG